MGCRQVGYVVSRFPKTTETFILREMQAVERRGWHVEPFAIRRERDEIVQPGAAVYAGRLCAISDLGIVHQAAEQIRLLRRDRRGWAKLWGSALVGNRTSAAALIRAIVVAFGAPAIARRVRSRQIAHLHAHWGTHSALLAHLVAMLTGASYSVTLHAHDLHVQRSMLGRKLAGASAVVTISEHNAALLRSMYPDVADRVVVVHCGVDTATVPLRSDAAPVEPITVVCVAGLRPFKGHRHLIAAVTELVRRGRVVTCHLVGDGPIRDELEASCGDAVRFFGALDVDRALEVVAAGDVFVMPSVELANGRRDGIPVALIEAMAIGVPVVASAVSGIPELVVHGHSGLLVEPGDPLAIADAVERIVDDESLRRRLVANARTAVAEGFELATSAAQMTELFEEALSGRPSLLRSTR